MYNAKIICDSISEMGKRLTTFEVTFPRIVLAEFNTHRMFSRNSASSRAIPFKKQIERVLENPFIPERFPIDGKGMQPNSYIYGNSLVYEEAKNNWLWARDSAIRTAKALYNCLEKYNNLEHEDVKIHKQIVNRLLEPFQWHTVICTATEFDNFFKLRTDENAQYEIRRIADLMYEAYHAYNKLDYAEITNGLNGEWSAIRPQKLKVGEWHLPFISDEDWMLTGQSLYFTKEETEIEHLKFRKADLNMEDIKLRVQDLLKKISVARCARVSYLTHDGKRDIEKDLELFERLRTSGHWSPFEHVATPYFELYNRPMYLSLDERLGEIGFNDEQRWINLRSGNFLGWYQMRKEFQDENCNFFRKEEK